MAVFLVANTTLYINELFGVPNGKCMLLMQRICRDYESGIDAWLTEKRLRENACTYV